MATKSATTASKQNGTAIEGQPKLHQRGREIQPFGTMRDLPIALDRAARQRSCELLNQLLADTNALYHLYKKHHWLVAGHTFYQLHLLFDKHAAEQLALIDTIAERIQLLGGIAAGTPWDVVQASRVPQPPRGAEEVPAMISRQLEAHEIVIRDARSGIELTEESKDYGTNDLLMSDVLRTNELQVWFLAEHLVDTPLVDA